MIKARYSDKALAIEVLTQAFEDNKSVNYVTRSGNKKKSEHCSFDGLFV
jgi:hypothetical protein